MMFKHFFVLFILSPTLLFGQIGTFLNKGQRLLESGRYDEALETLLQAEGMLEKSDDLEVAQCFNDLGVVYHNTGNRALAREYLTKSLNIRKTELPENHELLGDSHLNMGLTYLDDNFLQSIIHFNNALKIYRQSLSDADPKIALCYSNIAFAHRDAGNYMEAMNYLDLTMKILNKTYPGTHANKAFILSSTGRVLELQGNFEEALDLQQQALNQYLEIYGKKHPEVASTYTLIGSVQEKLRQYGDAICSFQKAIYANLQDQEFVNIYDLPDIRGYYNAEYLLRALQAKAQALESRHFAKSLSPKDIKSALETYAKCDELISMIRHRRLSEDDKIRLGAISATIYNNAIRIALYLSEKTWRPEYYREKAFAFCEKSKSATLLEAINETKAKSFAGIPDNLISLEDSLKNEISWLEKEVAKGNETDDEMKIRLFDYQKAYREFIRGLENNFPEYYQLKYQPQDVSVSDIQNNLSSDNALISYFLGNTSVYIFFITKKDFKVYDYPKDNQLIQKIAGLRNSIKYNVKEGFDILARSLYRQLIPEIYSDISKLIILPDGILGTIPYEALLMNAPEESRKYLLEEYEISYDYAASLYLNKINKAADMNAEKRSGIYLSAPVTFDSHKEGLPTLQGTKQEVMQIHKLFQNGSDTPNVCLQDKATESSFKSEQLSSYKYIHFATHGLVNESKPELSRIFLTPDKDQDGCLYSGEIYNLNLSANLITLSACETGLGKIEKGEGIIGLSRSLTYAGAQNLIVSLWQVADQSTSQLMIEFYKQHLQDSEDPYFADDLRQAKLMIIQSEDYSNPYYWAPFILIGQ